MVILSFSMSYPVMIIMSLLISVGLVKSHVFKIGLLIPKEDYYTTYGWETTASAVTMALEKITEDQLIPGHSIDVVWKDTKGNPVWAAGRVVELKNENVDVIIGPPRSISTIPVGYLTSYWNMPHISWKSSDTKMDDKSTFTTLVRTLGPFHVIGRMFSELFLYYNWKRAGLLTLNEGICLSGAEGIRQNFQKSNITLVEDIKYDARGLTDKALDLYLDDLKRVTRLIMLCAEQYQLNKILLRAHQKGMTTPDYVYIMAKSLTPQELTSPWLNTGPDEAQLHEAYHRVLDVTLGESFGEKLNSMRARVARRMADPPWNSTYAIDKGYLGSQYSPFLYDAVYLYGKLLNETLIRGTSYKDGAHLLEMTRNITFTSVTGTVNFDERGDRIPDYWVIDYSSATNKPEKIIIAEMNSATGEALTFIRQPHWQTHDGKAPTDIPPCGFAGELCAEDYTSRNNAIIGGVVAAVIAVTTITVVGHFIRKKQFEQELAMMLWKVDYKLIEFSSFKKTAGSQLSMRSHRSDKSDPMALGNDCEQYGIKVGQYKGNLVAVKMLQKDTLQLSRKDQIELKTIREMSHENLNPFVGACVDPPDFCILYMYCPKGSLQDILENDDIKLDWMFKYSLINDISNGVSYIHTTGIQSHGRLKSTNCVVDSRWSLKITDYGLNNILIGQRVDDMGEQERFKAMLWTAPELLRSDNLPANGTQNGDIYSFGILLHEICYRMGTFPAENMSPKDTIGRVRNGETVPFRPKMVDGSQVDPQLINLMEQCWAENFDVRPDFATIKRFLRQNKVSNKGNIMDTMLKMMERYANNLEDLVEQRTQELTEEKKKTDSLLYRLLPPAVAEKLKLGQTVDPVLFDCVTIFFSDIVGFTNISAKSTPIQVVNLLNDLYTLFDDIIAEHDVYKVETIGDAYMVVSGLPARNGDLHAGQIADMALNILSALLDFKIAHMPGKRLKIRIGIHSGPCCAGVVGLTMPRYCLFGDTVNTASNMESTAKGLHIHISEETSDLLYRLGGYIISPRGQINIKGKGDMFTYWLDGKEGFSKRLPDASMYDKDDIATGSNATQASDPGKKISLDMLDASKVERPVTNFGGRQPPFEPVLPNAVNVPSPTEDVE